MACRQARPIVDGLEVEWGDAVQVVRLNIHDAAAANLLQQLGFRFTPTFILFDKSGNEVWRAVGVLSPDQINQQVFGLK
ncbi:MAG: thioredoxin family protein [Ardenticatenaceae bacterium]|nr:thioredoxin family protein [Ardenticatenaceae bacterium]